MENLMENLMGPGWCLAEYLVGSSVKGPAKSLVSNLKGSLNENLTENLIESRRDLVKSRA